MIEIILINLLVISLYVNSGSTSFPGLSSPNSIELFSCYWFYMAKIERAMISEWSLTSYRRSETL